MIIDHRNLMHMLIRTDIEKSKAKSEKHAEYRLSVRNFLPRLFYIIPHCSIVYQPEYGCCVVCTCFFIIWTLCIPESWNGESLCRTHKSQRPIVVNCVRTRVLCHRKFRFCAGDWFYKKAKERARAYSVQSRR